MKPYKYTVINGVEYFHYKFSELREFLTLGKKGGNVGMILVKRSNEFTTSKGFGTIEHPNTTMFTLNMKPLHILGKPRTADEIIGPDPESPFKHFGIFVPDGKGGVQKLD